jgi:MerR family redox-sensitive transcriptional activator SoxR
MSEVERHLAIGEVAARVGMSASRIRFYEARGLLPPPERTGGGGGIRTRSFGG